MAPGLQFVIVKSGSWSNQELFRKRAFHHMAKMLFHNNCIHNRLQILGDQKNISGLSNFVN